MEMVEHSLYKMRYGGIYDQIGYGFHRYSNKITFATPPLTSIALVDDGVIINALLGFLCLVMLPSSPDCFSTFLIMLLLVYVIFT